MQERDGIRYAILYDSSLFTKTQHSYETYKWELCVIVEFRCKIRTLFQAQAPSIFYTDHKSLSRSPESGPARRH